MSTLIQAISELHNLFRHLDPRHLWQQLLVGKYHSFQRHCFELMVAVVAVSVVPSVEVDGQVSQQSMFHSQLHAHVMQAQHAYKCHLQLHARGKQDQHEEDSP